MLKLFTKLFKSQKGTIYDFISKDNSDDLRRILETEQDPNEPDEFGQTPIFRVVVRIPKSPLNYLNESD